MRFRQFLVSFGITLAATWLASGALAGGGGPPEIQSVGAGKYPIAGVVADFVYYVQQKNGEASGHFRHSVVLSGVPIDFRGRVTCLAVDPDNGRMWVGGVVTRNDSMHPSFTTPIHEPGRDIWFRVLDTGKRAAEPDRTTFVGFEGGGGIITSEEYCAAQIWPDGNARTNALSHGAIELKTRD